MGKKVITALYGFVVIFSIHAFQPVPHDLAIFPDRCMTPPLNQPIVDSTQEEPYFGTSTWCHTLDTYDKTLQFLTDRPQPLGQDVHTHNAWRDYMLHLEIFIGRVNCFVQQNNIEHNTILNEHHRLYATAVRYRTVAAEVERSLDFLKTRYNPIPHVDSHRVDDLEQQALELKELLAQCLDPVDLIDEE